MLNPAAISKPLMRIVFLKKIFQKRIPKGLEGSQSRAFLYRKRFSKFPCLKKRSSFCDPVDEATENDEDQKVKDELPVFGHVRIWNCTQN